MRYNEPAVRPHRAFQNDLCRHGGDRMENSMKFEQIWQGRNCNKNADDWFPVTVPGNIQYDYGVQHNFADVQYSDNYKQYLPLEDDHWEYRARLVFDRKPDERVFFVSGGIDYQYDILLNGECLYSYEGMFRGVDLELTDKYSFDVGLSYFEDDGSTKIVKCQVISDYGKVVYEKCGLTENSLSFEVESSTARYFYLRLIDKEGRRTFSPPVWCGREFDKYEEPDYITVESKDFEAYDEVSGKDAYALLDFDVERPWENGEKTASIVIDMKEEKELSALAYIHPTHPAKDKNDPHVRSRFHSKFPHKYRVSTSLDGKNFVTRAEGGFLTYVGEEYIRLGECCARYLKFEILSTVGREYERAAYVNATLHFGGLMFFKKA